MRRMQWGACGTTPGGQLTACGFGASVPPSFGDWSLVCSFIATLRISAMKPFGAAGARRAAGGWVIGQQAVALPLTHAHATSPCPPPPLTAVLLGQDSCAAGLGPMAVHGHDRSASEPSGAYGPHRRPARALGRGPAWALHLRLHLALVNVGGAGDGGAACSARQCCEQTGG